MAITNTPEVGKYLVMVAPSPRIYPWYRRGGAITRISGQRIYYTNQYGVEKFTHDAAAVCDTLEEAEALAVFAENAELRVELLLATIAGEDESLWGEHAATNGQ